MKLPEKCAYCVAEWNIKPEAEKQELQKHSTWNGYGGTDFPGQPEYSVTTVRGTKCCAYHAAIQLGLKSE